MVWEDSGTGGRPGSMWTINEMGMLGVTQRHLAPINRYFTLKSKRFAIRSYDTEDPAAGRPGGRDLGVDIESVAPKLSYCTSFDQIWTDKSCGARYEASVWRPQLAEGQVFFGDLMVAGPS